MAYGLEFTNVNGEYILDRETPTLIVLESFTLTTGDWGYNSDMMGYTATLSINSGAGYDNCPLVAIRSTTGGQLKVTKVLRDSTTGKYDTILIAGSYNTSTYDVLVLGSSNDSSAPNPVGSDSYGVCLEDSAGVVTYDSRWTNQASVSEIVDFPSSITATSAGAPSHYVSSNSVDVSLSFDNPGAFFVTSLLSGSQEFPAHLEGGSINNPVGGGLMYPAFTHSDANTLTCTAVKTGRGNTSVSGSYNGVIIVVRYLGNI